MELQFTFPQMPCSSGQYALSWIFSFFKTPMFVPRCSPRAANAALRYGHHGAPRWASCLQAGLRPAFLGSHSGRFRLNSPAGDGRPDRLAIQARRTHVRNRNDH